MRSGKGHKRILIVLALILLAALSGVAYLRIASIIPSQDGLQPATSSGAVQGKPSLLIEARVDNGPWIKTPSIYPLSSQRVALRVKKIPDAHVRWFSIRPDTSTLYKNANHPWEANPYQWIGFAKITYHRNELVGLRDQWEIRPFEEPVSANLQGAAHAPAGFITRILGRRQPDVQPYGSFWFQVEVERGGSFTRSYGIEDNDKRGLSPKVFRVSRRDGEGYLGFLTSFFNVPGLFGSIPYQSHNYIGVDCADVLVAAYSKWKNVEIKKDHCVASLVNGLPRAVEFDLSQGDPQRPIRWGMHIRPGYLIAVRYGGAKSYQHVGALVRDANKNGLLDGDDPVLHAGPRPLHYTLLKEGSFDGHVVVLKPDLSRLASTDHWMRHLARDVLYRFR